MAASQNMGPPFVAQSDGRDLNSKLPQLPEASTGRDASRGDGRSQGKVDLTGARGAAGHCVLKERVQMVLKRDCASCTFREGSQEVYKTACLWTDCLLLAVR